jgi:peptidoglycan/LPS O-acetylase OafA/YrhL
MAQTLTVEPATPAAASPGVFDFRQRFPALDGLRGLAILSVFLYHYAGGTDHHPTGLLLRAMYGVTQFGWAGVDLFFVLSGFLITGILFDTQNDSGYYGKFYARRSLRIFPIYYLFLAIMAGMGVAIGVHWRAGDGWFLLYAGFPAAVVKPDIIPQSAYIRITHLWSLCMEEQFYLVWPWLIAMLAAPKRILRMCVALMCVALTLRMLVWGAGWLSAGWAYTFLPFRMDSLALGAALAILIRGKHTDTLAKVAPYVLGVAAAGLLAVFLASGTTDHEGPWIDTIGFTMIAFASAGLLVLAVLRNGVVHQLFNTQALRTVGKYSYGLYLYHFPLAVLLDPIKPVLQSLLHAEVPAKLLFVIFSLAANLSVAWASFVFIEWPIMWLKSRFKYANKPSLESTN